MEVSLLNVVRDHYNYLTRLIIKQSDEMGPHKWVYPYCEIQWASIFSPIERQVWHAIRNFGHAPFYPQYPVNKFFVDFGNPYLKIAIECDGKEFHKDKQKDEKRDKDLWDSGWIVFRISGSDCNSLVESDYYKRYKFDKYRRRDIVEGFYETTIEGLLKAIAIRYFKYKEYFLVEEGEFVIGCLQKRVSIKESLT